MNKTNVLALADYLEALPAVSRFNMKTYMHCGTPSCMASYECERIGVDLKEATCAAQIAAEAASSLGLADEAGLCSRRAVHLFSPPKMGVNCAWSCGAREGEHGFITKQHAVNCLRNLAKTGRVDWDATAP